jgi:hypothetical protein
MPNTLADGPVIMRLTGPANAAAPPTPFDGQWVREYDPTRPGRDLFGRPMLAHLVTTTDRSRARRFRDAAEAFATWRAPSGLPYPANAPLTAYTIELERADDDADRP